MLVGTADIAALAADAPTVPEFADERIALNDVTCLQLTAEMHNSAREAVLPPSLHPTIPAAMSIQVYAVGDSPWGAFNFATVRISCRSGVRARGFTAGAVVDNGAAAEGMRTLLGFPANPGEINFRHGYDGASVHVTREGQTILALDAIDPEPMSNNDVQYTGTLNLAHTPRGLRLLQVESHAESSQVDRLTARLQHFDGAAWGNPLLQPVYVIAASIARMQLTYPPLRFICKVDELAFTGTEPVASAT